MNSKILIDIFGGEPQIRIDYKHTGEEGDVRDKLIGDFISGLFAAPHPVPQIDVSLELGHEDENGIVAFIRLKK